MSDLLQRTIECVCALVGHDPREVAPWKKLEAERRRYIDASGGCYSTNAEINILAELDAIRKEDKK